LSGLQSFKKKVITEKLSRTSLAQICDEKIYEKVYDAEVVEEEIRVALDQKDK